MNDQALKIAIKIIKMFEGLSLVSYPDPASPLYKALSSHNMLQKYMRGDVKWKDLPENFQDLSGHPWTIGYGATGLGINKDTVWTQAQADSDLQARVATTLANCLKNCSKLALRPPEGIAAIVSLAYNIGDRAFKDSTACKMIMSGKNEAVGAAIQLFNKAGGKVMDGLVKRRKIEADLWNSVK